MTDIKRTLESRGKKYGRSFAVQSLTAQDLKDVVRESPNYPTMKPDQREALDMIATKISRILHGDPNYHDSWFDIIGYAKLVADTLKVTD